MLKHDCAARSMCANARGMSPAYHFMRLCASARGKSPTSPFHCYRSLQHSQHTFVRFPQAPTSVCLSVCVSFHSSACEAASLSVSIYLPAYPNMARVKFFPSRRLQKTSGELILCMTQGSLMPLQRFVSRNHQFWIGMPRLVYS